jgi:hypothetical protein
MFIKENHKKNDDDAYDNDTDKLNETRDTEETENLLIIQYPLDLTVPRIFEKKLFKSKILLDRKYR